MSCFLPSPLFIDCLTKKYEATLAVDQLSLRLAPGEILGLLGPNGSGKTTIISNIMTLQKPTSGSIYAFGRDISKNCRKSKALIGFVPQELVTHGFFNVEKVLYFQAQLYGLETMTSYIHYLLKKLSLWPYRKRYIHELSGGMKRRLMIAKALIHRPKLLLLDEPTTGVDIELRSSLWDFINELKKDNLSILLTTHYLEEAEKLCDRIGILKKGKLKRLDKLENLIQNHAWKQVSILLKEPPPKLSHPLLIYQKGKQINFRVPPDMVIQELLHQISIPYGQIIDLFVKRATLEEAMQNILKES